MYRGPEGRQAQPTATPWAVLYICTQYASVWCTPVLHSVLAYGVRLHSIAYMVYAIL